MKKLSMLLAAVGAIVAVAFAGPAGAVQGGEFDAANTYSYVAMSVYYDAAGVPLWRCSGTMISPRMYVTAGHCTGLDEGSTPARAELWFTNKLTAADVGNYPFDAARAPGTPAIRARATWAGRLTRTPAGPES